MSGMTTESPLIGLPHDERFYFHDVHRIASDFVKYRIAWCAPPAIDVTTSELEGLDVLSAERAILALRHMAEAERSKLAGKLRRFSSNVFHGQKRYRVYYPPTEPQFLDRSLVEQFRFGGQVLVAGVGQAAVLTQMTVPDSPWPLPPSGHDAEDLERCLALLSRDFRAQALRRRRAGQVAGGFTGFRVSSVRRLDACLKFYYPPRSIRVLALIGANALKLDELAELVSLASESMDLEQSLTPWLVRRESSPTG